MKKTVVTAITILLVATMFTACGRKELNSVDKAVLKKNPAEVSGFWDEKDRTTNVGTTSAIVDGVSEVPINENDWLQIFEEKTKKQASPKRNPFNHKANRSRLTQSEQKIYDEFLEKILNFEEFIVDFASVSYDMDVFYRVKDAINADYPETWLYLYTNEAVSDEVYNGRQRFISVSYEYNWLTVGDFSEEYMKSYLNEMGRVCDEIISKMPEGLTSEEKYEFLGREICSRTVYVDKSSWNIPYEEVNWSWCYMNGPLLDGEGLCQAYAYAYQYLCHRAGLWCVTVSGECHCWNMIKLEDGSTYHVDLTWADVDWEEDGFNENQFLMTQKQCEYDHTPYDGEWVATGKK